jgi:hypothetical protein
MRKALVYKFIIKTLKKQLKNDRGYSGLVVSRLVWRGNQRWTVGEEFEYMARHGIGTELNYHLQAAGATSKKRTF